MVEKFEEKLIRVIDIFVGGVEEDFSDQVADLVDNGLLQWMKAQKSGNPNLKANFRGVAIKLVVKFGKIEQEDAEDFVDGFLEAIDLEMPDFWKM